MSVVPTPEQAQALRIADFTYPLPDERIAKTGLAQRDAARLLVCKPGAPLADSVFHQLPGLLPAHAMLVFNDTRVVPARLQFAKPTGGLIEIFCLSPLEGDVALAMARKETVRWKCLVGGAKKWKEGQTLTLQGPDILIEARLDRNTSLHEGFAVELSWQPAELPFAEVLERAGKVPLPPYLNREADADDLVRYQTVYASHAGAVAAPTAGLHFTPELLSKLLESGFEEAFVTLHVGAGTFKPVSSDQMAGHAMHQEQILIARQTLGQLTDHLRAARPIVPVGTTALRTLESLYWYGAELWRGDTSSPTLWVSQWQPYERSHDGRPLPSAADALAAIVQHMEKTGQQILSGHTELLIAPGYPLRLCDALITNFHQPESTLLLLVAALLGPRWEEVYRHALATGYRFLSFGDSSLLFRHAQ